MYTSIIQGPFPSFVRCSARRSISRWCLEPSFHLYYIPVDMSEDTVDKQEMWKQGCRAVFAGFVASAHQRGLPASIDIFWLTEQRDTILPSLRSLIPANAPRIVGDMGEKRALHKLLSEPGNGLTKCKETDELEVTVRWKEVEWGLTKRGRGMFPMVSPVKDREGETPTESCGDCEMGDCVAVHHAYNSISTSSDKSVQADDPPTIGETYKLRSIMQYRPFVITHQKHHLPPTQADQGEISTTSTSP